MNIVFVGNDARDADFFKHELEKSAPTIHVDLCPNLLDAMVRCGNVGACDIVVLDTLLPLADAVGLVSFIRKDKKPIAVVALNGADDENLPGDLLNVGVDHVATKRPGYTVSLVEIFQQLRERYRAETAPQRKQVRLLYAGNIEIAKRYLSNVSQLKLEPAPIAPDGTWHPQESTELPTCDALVLDLALTGTQALKAVKESAQHMPDVPIIVLKNAGDDETAIHAIRSGAADCIEKTGNYFHRLLLVLQRELGRKEAVREKTALKSREERIRHIVESLPAGVTVLAADGTCLAINTAGLQIAGATRLDQIVGKNISLLIPEEEQQRSLAFLATVCGGNNGSILVDLKGLDGRTRSTELRAVPMRRDSNGSTAALAVLSADGETSHQRSAAEEKARLEATIAEYVSRLRTVEEELTRRRIEWESALQDAESQRIAAEEQQDSLRAAAEETATRYALLLEKQRAERESWEQARKEFTEQCLKIEGVAQSLRSAQAGLLESHGAEQAQWNLQRQELEAKQKHAEQQISELSQALQKERSDWDLYRNELEQKIRTAEESRSSTEEALRAAESGLDQLAEKHSSELSQNDIAYRQLERKCQALEEQCHALHTALQSDKSSLAQVIDEHNAELARRDAALFELEQKCRLSEEQRTAQESARRDAESEIVRLVEKHNAELSLRDLAHDELNRKSKAAEESRIAQEAARLEAELKIAQLLEKHGAELSLLESRRTELERKCEAAEDSRISEEVARLEAESKITQLVERHNAELSLRDSGNGELEWKLQVSEKQNTALQAALRNAESGVMHLTEKHSAEISQYNFTQTELEKKLQAVENQKSLFETALHRAESSLAQMAEKHNIELSQLDFARQEFERKYENSEEQRLAIQAALQEAGSRLAFQMEKHETEIARRNLVQKEIEQKSHAAEKQVLAYRTALHDAESSLAQLNETHKAEISQCNLAHQELERKYQALETKTLEFKTALDNSNSELMRKDQEHAAEIFQQDLSHQELVRTCQDIKAQVGALQTALTDAQSALALQAEEHASEISRRELIFQELERKYQDSEASVRELQTALTRKAQECAAEISQRDLSHQELVRTCQDIRAQVGALQTALTDAQSALALQAEEHAFEISRRELIFQELERKYQDSEASVRELQTALTRKAQECAAEISQRDFSYQELVRTCQDIRAQVGALQTALGDAQSALALQTEERASENSCRDLAYQELECKYRALETKNLELKTTLDDSYSELTRKAQEHSAAITLRDLSYRDLDRKHRDSEAKIFALQNSLEKVESRLSDQIEKYTAYERRHGAEIEAVARNSESRITQLSEENKILATQLDKTAGEADQIRAEFADMQLRYERLSQFTSTGVVLTTRDGVVLQCNDSAARMFGFSNGTEVLSKSKENGFRIYSFEGALGRRLEKERKLENIEWTILGRGGKLVRLHESATLVEASTAQEPLVERVLTDITAAHNLKEEMRRTRRVESSGDLAAATVQSLKNLCVSLVNCGELLRQTPGEINAVMRLADAIANDANRGIKHARQFLSIAKKPEHIPMALSLNEVLTDNEILLHNLAGPDIDLQILLPQRIALVSANYQEVVQLISNIVASSREALPLGGTVVIEVSNVDIDSADGRGNVQPGTYVCMSVIADGCTVQPERRTGALRTIVERIGGRLESTHTSHSGNTHKIYLPRVEAFACKVDRLLHAAGEPIYSSPHSVAPGKA